MGDLEHVEGVDVGGQGSEVVRTLQEHGLSPAAARAAEAIGANLRQRTLGRAVELAAMLDADTGVAVGAVLGGAQASVDIRPHLDAMQLRRSYLSIHTHPGSSSFSPQDVDILLTHVPLRVMAVVGADGTWYVLSQRYLGVPNRPAVLDAFRDAVLAQRSKYLGLINSGTMSRRAAWRQHTHEAWTIVAAPAGLRYDRIEP